MASSNKQPEPLRNDLLVYVVAIVILIILVAATYLSWTAKRPGRIILPAGGTYLGPT